MVAKDVPHQFNTIENAPPIILEVLHDDSSREGEFLGRAVLNLADVSSTSDTNVIPMPKWHDIKFGAQELAPACGQILCSFAIISDDDLF